MSTTATMHSTATHEEVTFNSLDASVKWLAERLGTPDMVPALFEAVKSLKIDFNAP